MARVDPALIDALLLGQGDRRRQLQDFPVLGDVWAQFGSDPNGIHELLLTPHREASAPRLANFLHAETDAEERSLSYVHGLVAAQTTLDDLALVILPSTSWWHKTFGEREGLLRSDEAGDTIGRAIALHFALEMSRSAQGPRFMRHAGQPGLESFDDLPNVDRQTIRLGMLLGLLRAAGSEGSDQILPTFEAAAERLGIETIAKYGSEYLMRGWAAYRDYFAKSMDHPKLVALVWQVALNRVAEFALERSVPAIKADAAAQLFSISCSSLSWAILDSGIDANHPAFADRRSVSGSRVRATYDFGRIGDILNKANRFNAAKRRRVANEIAQKVALEPDDVEERLLTLAEAMGREQPISWTLVEPLIQRGNSDPPVHPHGTHVAGILGADWREREGDRETTRLRGVCPDINLYDFRVLGGDSEQSEFSIIAALQFIRYLNARSGFMLIDGVNMSLSIPHSVRNYACGYTPICVEAEKLVANGVVVVAAAGNRGYQQFQLADNSTFESYAASSITDPGNAEGVITVGATHRNWPHTYGVSFFSSRGPTGDGRLKPDLLAPGERIDSCVPGPAIDTMDGTSMAAPHVSGAAALLIARHQELKGRPARVKQILCETATDLGRERHFQGHGMIDVLRAIQSL